MTRTLPLPPQSHATSHGYETEKGARHALNPWQQQVSGGVVLVKLSPYPAVEIVYSVADALPLCSAPFDPSRPTSKSRYDSPVPNLLKKSKKGGYKNDRRTGIRLDRVRAPLKPVPARAFSGLRADKARAQAPPKMRTALVIPRALEARIMQPTSRRTPPRLPSPSSMALIALATAPNPSPPIPEPSTHEHRFSRPPVNPPPRRPRPTDR